MKKCFLVAMIFNFNGFTVQISPYKNIKLKGKTPDSRKEKNGNILDIKICNTIF